MNSRLIGKVFFLLLLISIFSCKKPQYNLTTQVTPTIGGTVSPSSGTFEEGTTIQLQSTPSTGYEFKEWSGSVTGITNPLSVTMNSDMNITSVFQKKSYPLNITIEGEGTVTEEVVTLKSNSYDYGTTVKLTPVPTEGWEFVEWSGDLTGSDYPVQITITDSTNITCKFIKDMDGDGVPDDVDQCNNTRIGVPIDEFGCMLNPIYLDDNGVTIKSYDWGEVGDSGEVDGIIYTIVNRSLLSDFISSNGQGETLVCTSKVTEMSDLFKFSQFNQDISSWDVSNVTSMRDMFGGSQFNQDISSWDVSKVTDMGFMFDGSQFNQDISSWDVSNVTDMGFMFRYSQFNQDISSWDVSNVTDMFSMFSYSQFNQDISSWDVSNVTSMRVMFYSSQFNQDISSWDVSKVTDMFSMFSYSQFNQDLSSWDVSNVTSMSDMFYGSLFNQDISSWDVSNVTSMSRMFQSSLFNQDISSWDVSKVTDMFFMFLSSQFNQDLSSWDVSNVTICNDFSTGTSSWTLPKPNFTNCNPN